MAAERGGSQNPARECAARTHVGRVRARNEDAILVDPLGRWAILADGMGGYRGGDVAARIAVETIGRRLAAEPLAGLDAHAVAGRVAQSVGQANERIWIEGYSNPELTGMGSTVVVVVFQPDAAISVHVGDSRLYRWRGGDLKQLTADHTVVQEQVDEGLMSPGSARHAPMRSMLTRGLGVMDIVEPEIGVHAVKTGDVFLLCSDGLTDMLDDEEICARLSSGDAVEVIAERLIDAANDQGGRDNVSVVIVRVRG
ncbi:MAG: serine/threonine-protein phosphatase [Rhodocyclaceae bacterium]|nr:serine/threonine-protein phosphatase [Rhodocyclaceae bacterium]MCL4756792.1 serine/threonine-protein phosphatase [Rhodocyclaceae bacterium]